VVPAHSKNYLKEHKEKESFLRKQKKAAESVNNARVLNANILVQEFIKEGTVKTDVL
jgi:hypothetical protein